MEETVRIGAAFAAAHDYDGEARVQRAVASDLADRIAELPLPCSPRVLEIGCGTGFLTQAALDRGIGGEWVVTDIAPAMVERCRARLADRGGLRFAVLDGEHGSRPPEAPFDLICSSLAVQWFADLPGAVARLIDWLAPGGELLFTTLAADTFQEWRAAHEDEGLIPGILPLPSVAALSAMHARDQASPVRVDARIERHPDARHFLRRLKAIGAGTPRRGHRPLPPAALRRVMCRFEANGAGATYQVVTCHYRRAE